MPSYFNRTLTLFYLSEWAQTFDYLSQLLGRGYSLHKALELTLLRPMPPLILKQIEHIRDRLLSGAPILESLSPTLAMVMSYSFSTDHHIPNIGRFFSELSASLTQRHRYLCFLLKELSYPAFLLSSFLGFFIFFYLFIMPLFTSFFSNFNLPVPQAILFLQNFHQHTYTTGEFLRMMVIPGLIFLTLLYGASTGYRKLVSPYLYSVFFRGWSILLLSGLSLKKSLLIYPPSFLSPHKLSLFQRRLNDTGDIIAELTTLMPLSKSAISVLSDGLSSGRFPDALSQVSDELQQLAISRVSRILRLVKPCLLLLFGLLILVMVQLLFLPLIQGMSAIQ
jgi:type II secretory pathway component PulF